MNQVQRAAIAMGVAVMAVASPVYSADFCIELIRRDIYNHYVSVSGNSSYQDTQRKICSTYKEFVEDNRQNHVAAQYKVFGASADWSASQIRSVGQAMCDEGYSVSQMNTSDRQTIQTVDASIGRTIEECGRASASGVSVSQDLLNGEETVVVTVRAVSGVNSTFEDKPSWPASLRCNGPLTLVEKGTPLVGGGVTSMNCERLPEAEFEENGRRFKHHGGAIVVFTAPTTLTVGVSPVPVPEVPAPASVPARIVRVETAPNSSDGNSCVKDDRIASLDFPNGNYRGPACLVKAEFPSQAEFAMHDHVVTQPHVPDQGRAYVTFEFDKPVVISAVEIQQHQFGVKRVEGFVGENAGSLRRSVGVGGAAAPASDHVPCFREHEVSTFNFTEVKSSKFLKVVFKELCASDGWAIYRMTPIDSNGNRLRPSGQ